jgi:hypothetical protein
MLEEGREGMMADEQRARLRQMLLSLRKRVKEYRQRLEALDVEINQKVKIAQFFFNSAKAKYVSPDLRMAQRTAARRFERSAAVAKEEKARVRQQIQGHVDLCEQVTGVLAVMKT